MPRHFLDGLPFFGDDQPHGDIGAFVPPLDRLETEVASRGLRAVKSGGRRSGHRFDWQHSLRQPAPGALTGPGEP